MVSVEIEEVKRVVSKAFFTRDAVDQDEIPRPENPQMGDKRESFAQVDFLQLLPGGSVVPSQRKTELAFFQSSRKNANRVAVAVDIELDNLSFIPAGSS